MIQKEGGREGSQAARGVATDRVLLFQVLAHSRNPGLSNKVLEEKEQMYM